MVPFLQQTARYIFDKYGENLAEVAIVLPNRRAGLFFRKYLSGMLTKTSWSPAILSTEEFIASLSGLHEVGQVHCLFELYKVHQIAEKEKSQPFDEFLNWGGQLLTDFNEIDRYLVDPAHLFSYLDEVRAMTVWNPDHAPLTEFQQNYLKFYHSLISYYTGLTEILLSRGEAYQGLMFRHAWENLKSGKAEPGWRKIIFAGFNALTAAEENIIGHLVEEGTADLLWDADRYYTDDPKQEAGDYLREWFRRWPEWSEHWRSDDFRDGPKEIHVTGVPDSIGQVKLAGNLLEEWNQQHILNERTAVILPDEQLLLPLLNSLPKDLDAVNITMGLPLSQTPLAGILVQIFDMHLYAVRMSGGKKSGRFYFQHVVKVLLHPYISILAAKSSGGNQFIYEELIARVKTGQKTFLRHKDLIPPEGGLFINGLDFLDLIFGEWSTIEQVVSGLQVLVEAVVVTLFPDKVSDEDGEEMPRPRIELEYAYSIAKVLRQLRLLVEESSGFITWDSFGKFFSQLLSATMLPFFGEPLKGLQIMGMLETRTLDFDRVIILSCNEGILPSGKNIQSFIPFDVRRDFNLPLYRQKDAVYAYHFYRLLQRASSVFLIYSTEPGQLGGGDQSRFIRQIETELPAFNPAVTIRNEMLVTPLNPGAGTRLIEIAKGPAVWEKLKGKAATGFAPTSLNAFRACSLKFYFSEVAGLKEPEEDEGEIDPRILGSAVHHALMNLYKPFVRQILTRSSFQQMELRIDEEIDNAFKENFNGDQVSTGKNLLLVEVARIMVRKFIRSEISLVAALAGKGETMTVDLLEQPLHRNLSIDLGGIPTEIRIKGFVDRVDRIGGVKRVIDYKTGVVSQKDVAVVNWDDLISDPAVDKGFQLLLYSWLLAGKPGDFTCKAGIISLKKQAPGFVAVTLPDENGKSKSERIGPDELTEMEQVLIRLLRDIYDPDQSFSQTPDEERCKYCPYKPICDR